MVILGKRQTCPSKPTPRRTIRLDANTTSGVRQKTEDPQITEMGVNALCDHYENLVRSMIGLSKVGMEVEEVDPESEFGSISDESVISSFGIPQYRLIYPGSDLHAGKSLLVLDAT
jgi:hypothetical protein